MRRTADGWDEAYEEVALRLIAIREQYGNDAIGMYTGNPVVSHGSLMTMPDVPGRLRSVIERGGKIVVVDPRRTETESGVIDLAPAAMTNDLPRLRARMVERAGGPSNQHRND